MDSDEEYSDFEMEEWDDLDNSGGSVIIMPSFETLTAEDIVHLMNQYIEQVNAIVQVFKLRCNKCCNKMFSSTIFFFHSTFISPVANNYHTNFIGRIKMGEARSIG